MMTKKWVKDRYRKDGIFSWIVCLCSIIAIMISYGMEFCFSIVVRPIMDEFNATEADVGWIQSTHVTVQYFSMSLSSLLEKRIGFAPVVSIATIITCISCLTSMLDTHAFHLIITHGILGGIGAGTFYMFGLIVCNFYFEKNRGLASGVSFTGGGVGVIILSYLVNASVAYYSWKGYFIIWGSICLLGFPLAYIVYMVPHESDIKENIGVETTPIIGDEKVRANNSKMLS